MPILVERKLFKIGEGAIAVTLPKAWINYYHLEARRQGRDSGRW